MFTILRRVSPLQKRVSRLNSSCSKPWNLYSTTNSIRNLSITSADHDIYISSSSDPYFNLTLEDWYVGMYIIFTPAYLRVYFTTGFFDIPLLHHPCCSYIEILLALSSVGIKIHGQRLTSLRYVPSAFHSCVEEAGEEQCTMHVLLLLGIREHRG